MSMAINLKCPTCEAIGTEQPKSNPLTLARYFTIPGIPPTLGGINCLVHFQCPNGHAFYVPIEDVEKIRMSIEKMVSESA